VVGSTPIHHILVSRSGYGLIHATFGLNELLDLESTMRNCKAVYENGCATNNGNADRNEG
jgi:hypothetical protein